MNSSTASQLLIPRPVYTAMIAQAMAEAPNECCGLLAGQRPAEGEDRRAIARYSLANVLSSRVEYESDPRAMFDAMKDMRRNGWDVLGVYHSHPTSPPVPSRRDRERNYSEQVVNFIISLQLREPEVRGWWLTATEYHEAEWAVTD